jgi:hypothetical protein
VQQSSCLAESARRLKNVQLSKDSDFQSRRPRLLCWVLLVSERDHRRRRSCSTGGNAGVPASGGGSVAAAAQREENGSKFVNYWFGAPSSDAPLNYKFAMGITLAALVDDRSCRSGLMRVVHDDTFLSRIHEASSSGPCAESPAYTRQTGRPARRAR